LYIRIYLDPSQKPDHPQHGVCKGTTKYRDGPIPHAWFKIVAFLTTAAAATNKNSRQDE
jgi:hypothetical protein